MTRCIFVLLVVVGLLSGLSALSRRRKSLRRKTCSESQETYESTWESIAHVVAELSDGVWQKREEAF